MIDFFEFSNEMLCLANEQGYFTRVNPAWTRTLGWTADELTSRPFIDFVHPEDIAATIQEAQLLQSGRETIFFENRYRCRDGSYRWLAWRAVFEPDSRQLVATARDITDQKLQAKALAEAEQKFRGIYEQAPLGIALIDSQSGQFLQINHSYEHIIGRTEEEMVKLTFQEITYPDDLEEDLRNMEMLQQDRIRHFQLEKRLLRGDGSVMWANLTVVPMWQIGEMPNCHLAIVEDITERKAMQDALRESEDRFRAFMDHSPAIAWAKDEQGRHVYLNKAYEKRFQVRLDDWQGKTDFEVWPQEVAQSFWKNDQQVLANNEPLETIEEVVAVDHGRSYWFNNKFVYWNRRNERFIGGVGVDITPLKQTEQALRTEQDLLRNLIEVQEKEKQFLCHEFHDGLIQYAVGSAMLLESCRNNPQAADNASKIDMALANLRRGVEDGRRVIRGVRPAVLDNSGLEAALEDLVGQYETSGILVTSTCDPAIGRLPEMIQTTVYRVVQEALSNAKKHSGTDVVRIELKKANGDLHLEVRDFGCGFNVESARMKGFGLMGIKERVRLLGGECLIQSELDAGTRIAVRLPIPRTDSET